MHTFNFIDKKHSAGMYSTGLVGFLCGLGIPLCVTLSDDESFHNYGGSLAIPYKNIHKAGIGECTGDANTFSIA